MLIHSIVVKDPGEREADQAQKTHNQKDVSYELRTHYCWSPTLNLTRFKVLLNLNFIL